MQEISSDEVRTHFLQILSRVAEGEKFTITKHGEPIALLIPATQIIRPDVRKAIANIKRLQKSLL